MIEFGVTAIFRIWLVTLFILAPCGAFAGHIGPENLYPNEKFTPGGTYTAVTKENVCTPGYSKIVRNVSASTRKQVFKRYGVPYGDRHQYELDHFVSLELGGNNAVQNLWPEPLEEALRKDKVENWLHARVCDGSLTLKQAQKKIEDDWYRIYIENHLEHSRSRKRLGNLSKHS